MSMAIHDNTYIPPRVAICLYERQSTPVAWGEMVPILTSLMMLVRCRDDGHLVVDEDDNGHHTVVDDGYDDQPCRLIVSLLIRVGVFLGSGEPGQPLVHLEQGLSLARVFVSNIFFPLDEGFFLDHFKIVKVDKESQQHSLRKAEIVAL